MNVLSNLPNIPAQDVPIGADENSNLEVRKYREKDSLILCQNLTMSLEKG